MGNHNSGRRHHHHHHLPNHNNVEPPSQPPAYYHPPPPASNHAPQPPPTNQMALPSVPYSHVDYSLRTLVGQAEGFGRFAIGGLHGALYHVTTLSDDGPGSLRAGCRVKEPLWVVFEVSVVTFQTMTKQCLLEPMLRTMATNVCASQFTIVSLMGPVSGILVLGMRKCICITITPETGAFMLSVPVLNHRYFHNAIYTKQDRRNSLSNISPRRHLTKRRQAQAALYLRRSIYERYSSGPIGTDGNKWLVSPKPTLPDMDGCTCDNGAQKSSPALYRVAARSTPTWPVMIYICTDMRVFEVYTVTYLYD